MERVRLARFAKIRKGPEVDGEDVVDPAGARLRVKAPQVGRLRPQATDLMAGITLSSVFPASTSTLSVMRAPFVGADSIMPGLASRGDSPSGADGAARAR